MIEIRKTSITDLQTDAIVNAANSSLWPGAGVCGAVFRAAGREELRAACNAIGHCDVGDAVITPGFALKAKYIIHAVGPLWEGGHDGEETLLYGAYYHSLCLAEQYGCTSIGFPLISAGIFGYPVDKAWRVAIAACLDFARQNRVVDVIFAVIDDEILAVGKQVLAQMQQDC